MSEDPYDEIERMLASLFGQQVAADAVGALRASGIDPGELARMGAMPDLSSMSPGQMMALRAQMQQMLDSASDEPVNWDMGKDLALQTVRAQGDPEVTAALADGTRQALRVADLWLDTATDFMPAPGAREAWIIIVTYQNQFITQKIK